MIVIQSVFFLARLRTSSLERRNRSGKMFAVYSNKFQWLNLCNCISIVTQTWYAFSTLLQQYSIDRRIAKNYDRQWHCIHSYHAHERVHYFGRLVRKEMVCHTLSIRGHVRMMFHMKYNRLRSAAHKRCKPRYHNHNFTSSINTGQFHWLCDGKVSAKSQNLWFHIMASG